MEYCQPCRERLKKLVQATHMVAGTAMCDKCFCPPDEDFLPKTMAVTLRPRVHGAKLANLLKTVRRACEEINKELDLIQATLPEASLSSLEQIQKLVAFHCHTTVANLSGRSNARAIVRPRQIACYLASKYTDLSLPQMGKAFGGFHHTTIIASIRAVRGKRARDPELDELLCKMERRLGALPSFSVLSNLEKGKSNQDDGNPDVGCTPVFDKANCNTATALSHSIA